MAAPDAPPFPLPDLPRAPDSDISRMARRVLEWRDMEALTRLPDALRDAGRDDDAQHICEMLGMEMHQQFTDGCNSNGPFRRIWENAADEIARVVWFDIFDWASTLGVMGRALAKPSGPVSGTHGSVTAGGVTVTAGPWTIDSPVGSGFPDAITAASGHFPVTLSAVPDADVSRLHAEKSHPDYEYRDAHECPDGPGWEHNPRAISAMLGDACWMRRRTPSGGPQ